ncbi:hypothetical protein AOLI_G00109050 [Acnodon oligacanthus]
MEVVECYKTAKQKQSYKYEPHIGQLLLHLSQRFQQHFSDKHRHQRTVTMSGGPASSDTLILNMVFTCVIVCLNYILYLINSTYMIQSLAVITMLFDAIGSMAQVQFHSWICVEHCLAVVFPVFYLKFKQHGYSDTGL